MEEERISKHSQAEDRGSSKSSRKSSVLPNQRASSSGHQLSSDKKKASTSSDASQEHLTVFERLGQKENSPIQET
uniref:Uncharacterized protein n=1 Tax=Brassica oleracea TaxID=3712 RepID=A0A3P6DUS9_BRAOL|nr:unnamed protein product [Brassica oleracea]